MTRNGVRILSESGFVRLSQWLPGRIGNAPVVTRPHPGCYIGDVPVVMMNYLQGYALCRRPPLASWDRHLGPWCILFGILGAPWGAILAPREAPRDHPGAPWEQQDRHEVANDRICVDLGVISGLVSASFWLQNA